MFQKLAYSMVFGEGGALGSKVVYWGHFLWILLLLLFCLLFVDLGFAFICVFLLFLVPCPPQNTPTRHVLQALWGWFCIWWSLISRPSLATEQEEQVSIFSEGVISENIHDWLAFLHVQMFLSHLLLRGILVLDNDFKLHPLWRDYLSTSTPYMDPSIIAESCENLEL